MARGHIRQRSKKSKDSYTVYIYLGVDPATGKKKYTTEVVHNGKRDAEKRLTELLRRHDNGEYVAPPKGITAEFLEHWFKGYAETHVNRRTLEGYRGNLDRHIIPALGNISLDKLTARQIESLESGLRRRGLSTQTVVHCHRLICPEPPVGSSHGDVGPERGGIGGAAKAETFPGADPGLGRCAEIAASRPIKQLLFAVRHSHAHRAQAR